MFASAPWFDCDVIYNDLLIERYLKDECLPGGVLVGVLAIWCWLQQHFCYDVVIFIDIRTPHVAARVRFDLLDIWLKMYMWIRQEVILMLIYRANWGE